jgi:hypothetical protein
VRNYSTKTEDIVKKEHKTFFDRLGSKLNLQNSGDWLSIKKETVIENGGEFILKEHHGSLIKGIFRKPLMRLLTLHSAE